MLDPARIKGIIFDYGGTLDSGGDHWCHVFLDAYAAAGLKPGFGAFRDAYIRGERAAAVPGAILPHFSMTDVLRVKVAEQLRVLGAPPRVLDTIVELCCARAANHTAAARKSLERLLPMPMAVASNFYGNLRSVLDSFGLSHLFRTVIDSGAVGIRKPDPAIFCLALDRMGIRPHEALVVGDSVTNDLLPAAALGCLTARIAGRPWPEAPESDFVADFTGSIAELADTLLTHIK